MSLRAWARAGIFPEGDKISWTDKNDLFCGAESASEHFRALYTDTAMTSSFSSSRGERQLPQGTPPSGWIYVCVDYAFNDWALAILKWICRPDIIKNIYILLRFYKLPPKQYTGQNLVIMQLKMRIFTKRIILIQIRCSVMARSSAQLWSLSMERFSMYVWSNCL